MEAPEGDPLRRWSASGAAIPDGARRRAVHVPVLVEAERDRRSRRRRRPRPGARRCWPGPTRWCGRGARGSPSTRRSRPTRSAARAPHLTVTTITPFGLEGPWRDRAATEFTLQAWSGGIVGLGRGAPDRAPVSVGGQIGEWLTGVYAAIGTLASRARARLDGPGELVDVSMLETLALCLTYYPVTYVDMVGRPFRERAVHRHARGGDHERRPGRPRRRDRPAVARLLRDGRAPRVDGGPLALRRPHPPAARHRGVDGRAHDRRGPRADRRLPHPPRPDRQRRDDPRDRPLRGARARSSPNPGGDFVEPGPPYRFDPPLLRARRAGAARWASTTTAAGEPPVDAAGGRRVGDRRSGAGALPLRRACGSST